MLGVGEHVYSRIKTCWSVFLKISVIAHLEERISKCINWTNVQMLGVGEHVYSRVKTTWSVFLKISVITHLEERISTCIITKTTENFYFQLDKILNVLATCHGRGI